MWPILNYCTLSYVTFPADLISRLRYNRLTTFMTKKETSFFFTLSRHPVELGSLMDWDSYFFIVQIFNIKGNMWIQLRAHGKPKWRWPALIQRHNAGSALGRLCFGTVCLMYDNYIFQVKCFMCFFLLQNGIQTRTSQLTFFWVPFCMSYMSVNKFNYSYVVIQRK